MVLSEDKILSPVISYQNVLLDDVNKGQHETVSDSFIENVFDEVDNRGHGLPSFLFSLSQYLYGSQEKHKLIEEAFCDKYKSSSKAKDFKKDVDSLNLNKVAYQGPFCNIQDVRQLMVLSKRLYKINLVFFEPTNSNSSFKVHILSQKLISQYFYLKLDKTKNKFVLLLVKQGHRSPYVEYFARKIDGYRYLKPYKSLDDVQFKVLWEDYDDNDFSYEPIQNLYDNETFHKYLKTFKNKKKKPLFYEDASKECADYLNDGKQPAKIEPVAKRTRSRRLAFDVPESQLTKRKTRKKKNLTGKKMTIVGDVLDLNGKGGIYAYYPYETLDERNKGIFKVGMSTNLKERFEQIHSYHPNGVYLVAFYSNPTIPEWSKSELDKWKKEHKTPAPSKKTMMTKYYLRMERFVFRYLEANKAKRIYATTRVNNPNDEKMGATEYFYTNEDLIHEAFKEAEKAFKGGNLEQFFLQGVDSNTGELVENINSLAKEREETIPSFTGKVIYRL